MVLATKGEQSEGESESESEDESESETRVAPGAKILHAHTLLHDGVTAAACLVRLISNCCCIRGETDL